jgi:hypothetical protein
MLWTSLLISCVFLFIANLLAFQKKLGEASAVGFFGIVGGWLCAGPAIALTGLLTGLGGLLFWFQGARPRGFLIYSLGAMLASHLIVGLFVVVPISERHELRVSYPAQSLSSRLAYESRIQGIGSQGGSSDQRALNATAKSHLEELENEVKEDTLRVIMLGRLHENVVEDFIDSPGFGVARVIRPRKHHIDLPEAASISFPPPAYDPETGGVDIDPILKPDQSPTSEKNLPTDENLWGLHRDSVIDFVNPKGFGYVKDREHVRGFQSHQFHAMPCLPESSQTRWLIQKIELVSLLTHDEPVVYVSDHLPRMDELRAAPTRNLTDFEKLALDALKSGTDLKVQSSANRIDVLGSIRAVTQCVKCHDVSRGDLLGAFSYYLKRDTVSGLNRK